MKRVFFFFSFFLMSCIILAQEAEEVTEEYVGWSDETKWGLLAVWGFIVFLLTARTFRNKADM